MTVPWKKDAGKKREAKLGQWVITGNSWVCIEDITFVDVNNKYT